jgi:hypothetical protein
MRASKTYFEQIPVETVKKIITEVHANNAIGNDSVSDETENQVTVEQEGWREVARKVQQEQDPRRMIGLVQQLIASLDDEQCRKPLAHTSDGRNLSPDSGSRDRTEINYDAQSKSGDYTH